MQQFWEPMRRACWPLMLGTYGISCWATGVVRVLFPDAREAQNRARFSLSKAKYHTCAHENSQQRQASIWSAALLMATYCIFISGVYIPLAFR
jgi:hypothetical protein